MGLQDFVDGEQLWMIFSGYGKLISIEVIRDNNDWSKGYGFVGYSSHTRVIVDVNG